MTDLQRQLRVTREHNSDGTHNAAAATTMKTLLPASATPAANTVVISQAGNQYINLGWIDLFASETSAKTSGSVTITAAGDDILTLDLGTVTAGQRWWISGCIHDGTKGGTGGEVRLAIMQSSGTATIIFMNDRDRIQQAAFFSSGDTLVRLHVGDYMQITGSGTLVMKSQGSSAGSNTTMAAGEAQIYATRFK